MRDDRSTRLRTREWLDVRLVLGTAMLLLASPTLAQGPDPLASNNALYPPAEEYAWGFRPANFDYPTQAVPSKWQPGAGLGQITTANAAQYMTALKTFLTPTISELVNAPTQWTPAKTGWYDMPWMGQGSPRADGSIDPNSGRESLKGSYTGQILEPDTFKTQQPKVPFQNHAVIYYNDVAAFMLGEVWRDLYDPDLTNPMFPEGSIVVKVESATLSPGDWPPLAGSTESWVYRPTVTQQMDPSKPPLTPSIVPVYFSQMAIAVKDSTASPATGWVYAAFAYDTNAPGSSVWEKAVPVGAMWGNDPQFANTPSGTNPNGALLETWVNPQAPVYTHDTLGWGGRLAGPMDVATRHNVLTVSGKRVQGDTDFPASSCLSCHGAAQFPFTENLYPSPNKVFPLDGKPFLFWDPGSPEWARWFQNRAGNEPLTGNGRTGIVALDYDMLLTFALATWAAAADENLLVQPHVHVH